MKHYVSLKDVPVKDPNNKIFLGYDLLGEQTGCVSGCKAGVGIFISDEYNKPGIHYETQEGFFVLEGSGWTKIGDEEIKLEPGMSYLVPANVLHCSKKDPDSKGLKVFFFHAKV